MRYAAPHPYTALRMLKLRAFVLATPSTVDQALTDYDYEEDTRYVIIHGDCEADQ